MKKLAAFLLLLSLSTSQAARECAAQQQQQQQQSRQPQSQPREGYIRTGDGVRLFYKIVGEGPETLVAVHGGPGNTFESILADLAPLAKNRRVIYYDQRGGGRSELTRDRDKLAISKHVADLEAVRSFFGLERMTLLGNSWGGMLVAYYAAAHPERVARMVLHSPGEPTRAFAVEAVEEMQSRMGNRYTPAERKRYGFVSDPRNWVKAEDPLALCREFYAMLLPIYVSKPESMKSFKGDVCAGPVEAVRYQQVVNVHIMNSLGDWNLLPSLGVVKAPVLVIHGEADPIPVESSEAWARAFPDAQLLLVEGAGHLPQVEQPDVFFEAVETFLKGGRVKGARKLKD